MLRRLRSILVGLIALACALLAWAGEVAVLRNGFTIAFERKEVKGKITRLYVQGGFVDVPSADIESFEQADDPPPAPVPAPAPAQPAADATAATQQAQAAQAAAQPVAATQPASQTTYTADVDQLVRDISSRYHLDPDFVSSVIKAESNFHVRAVSPKGAQGLMQLMPATAAQLGVTNAFDPKANVEGGTAYLSALLELYHDDPIKALAAYNAGAHRVQQYHGVPPYMETRAYVARIIRDFNAKKRAQMKAASEAQASTSANQAAATTPTASPAKATKKKRTKPAQPQDTSVPNPQGPS